jgi:type VI secretion system secreted protein VgrG
MKHLKLRATARSRTATIVGALTLAIVASLAFASTGRAAQATVPLGNAASFGALSFSAMTNAGLNTVVGGDVGSSTSMDAGITHPGFAGYLPPALQLSNAQASLLTAYGNAEAQTPTGDITGVNLAGKTVMPGVYNSTGSILISGPTPLVLNGNGNADAVFIFQAASSGDLTVDPTSSVTYTNGAQPCNVFWKVQSAFLKNTGSTFVGTILALTQITLTDSITVQGRVLARNADVTFIHDTVNVPTTCVTQASIDAAAAAATAAAAAAAQAAAAASAAAQAAIDAAAQADRAAEAARIADAKAASDAADKAAAAAAAAVKAAAIAAAAVEKAAADAAAAATAKAAAVKAAKSARIAKAAATRARIAKAKAIRVAIKLKRQAIRAPHAGSGFTG